MIQVFDGDGVQPVEQFRYWVVVRSVRGPTEGMPCVYLIEGDDRWTRKLDAALLFDKCVADSLAGSYDNTYPSYKHVAMPVAIDSTKTVAIQR